MIADLGGYEEDAKAFLKAVDKVITSLDINDTALTIGFADGTGIELYDGGQSCCESRYMRTDDKLEDYVGTVLRGAEVKDGPDAEEEYGAHEQQFLEVKTSRGSFTIVNHVEHNGYYGGFALRVRART